MIRFRRSDRGAKHDRDPPQAVSVVVVALVLLPVVVLFCLVDGDLTGLGVHHHLVHGAVLEDPHLLAKLAVVVVELGTDGLAADQLLGGADRINKADLGVLGRGDLSLVLVLVLGGDGGRRTEDNNRGQRRWHRLGAEHRKSPLFGF